MAKHLKKWDRQSGEGSNAYELALIYFSLGASRSPELVAEECVKEGKSRSLGLINNLRTKFKWISRARAYDEHILKVQWKAIENSTKEKGVVWAERIEQYRDTDRKSTRLNSSHIQKSRMPSSA